jgi:hypothetical protein
MGLGISRGIIEEMADTIKDEIQDLVRKSSFRPDASQRQF